MKKLLIVLLALTTNVYGQLTFSTEGKSIASYNEQAGKFNDRTYYDDNSVFWFNEDYTILYQKGDANSVLILTTIIEQNRTDVFTFSALEETLVEVYIIIDYNQNVIKLMFDDKGITYLVTYHIKNILNK